MISSSYVLCFAAEWDGTKEKIIFNSVHQSTPKVMLKQIHALLDEADIVVTYNGKSFDLPTLNKEFILHGMLPPSPYKQVDLLKVCRSEFRFASNKMDYVSQALGLGHKVRHPGFELWVKCMKGEKSSWNIMRKYNIQDVKILKKLYYTLLPWIKNHPNSNLYGSVESCPRCGSKKFQSRGTAVSISIKYRRFQCLDCGGWFKGEKEAKQVKPKYQGIH